MSPKILLLLIGTLIKATLLIQLPIHAASQLDFTSKSDGSMASLVAYEHPLPSTVLPPVEEVAQAETSSDILPVPPLPGNLPEPFSPDGQGILGLYPDPDDDIGVGHLRPTNLAFFDTPNSAGSSLRGAGWLSQVAIPLYTGPNGDHWGWLIRGWLIPNGYAPIAIGRDASFVMLHTFYDLFSFPVMEIRPDGWFRFQYSSAGTVWAHTSQLGLGQLDLMVEPWEERFVDASLVYFRNTGAAHALRSHPDSDRPLIASVGSDSLIEPIEFYGDWMRVRVSQPADGCLLMPEARMQEGWMRWRTLQQNVRIWFPPSGC